MPKIQYCKNKTLFHSLRYCGCAVYAQNYVEQQFNKPFKKLVESLYEVPVRSPLTFIAYVKNLSIKHLCHR